jgi:hypothetical protein
MSLPPPIPSSNNILSYLAEGQPSGFRSEPRTHIMTTVIIL